MRILVIGSKGFIGSHVCHFYGLRQGYEVWGCDVVTDYATENYFQIDATTADYEPVFTEQLYDVCINCSGAASVPDSFVHPSRDFLLNVVNVQRMLDAIRKHNPSCKFVNLSSAAVYGNPSSIPTKESDFVHPLSPYGWHKLYAENVCKEYHTIYKLSTCSLRIFSAYGQGLQKQIFWDWYQKIRKNETMILWGTGNESRDFIFINDIVFAIQCVVEKAPFEAEVINIANGEEIYISEAIEIFKKYSGEEFQFTFNNVVRQGDPIRWCADISLLKSFGYQPRTRFDEGIKEYWKWLRERK